MNLEELDAALAELDQELLADMVTFATIELESRDVEPWADLLHELYTRDVYSREQVWWLTTLYSTYDSLGSAWGVFDRWPSPYAWANAMDREDAASHRLYPRMTERRNLHGTAVLKRHGTYVDELAGRPQLEWLAAPLELESPGEDFKLLSQHMQKIWGVGRQAAFEWAEFAGKVAGLPVDAADGQLWESSGPRQSLEALYGMKAPNTAWLDEKANECKQWLADAGADLAWVDFETIICDFKVMVAGRYVPGQHLSALREEIDGIADIDARMLLLDCFNTVVPEPWASIPPGSHTQHRGHYKRTGEVVVKPWWI